MRLAFCGKSFLHIPQAESTKRRGRQTLSPTPRRKAASVCGRGRRVMSSITWFGHSAFKIGCPDVQVVIDPFFAPPTDVNAATLGPVDLVLVTHDHSDHVGEAVEVCRRSGAMLGAIVGTAANWSPRRAPGADPQRHRLQYGRHGKPQGRERHHDAGLPLQRFRRPGGLYCAHARRPHRVPCGRYLRVQRYGAVGAAVQH